MPDADDVRRLALSLPHIVEIDSAGFDFRVGNMGFVWSYPESVPGRPRVIRSDIAVLYVSDEADRQALVPIGKNISGSTSRQAARSIQASRDSMLMSPPGRARSV
jgi:hypothetical protein